jgi:hypothetical protein
MTTIPEVKEYNILSEIELKKILTDTEATIESCSSDYIALREVDHVPLVIYLSDKDPNIKCIDSINKGLPRCSFLSHDEKKELTTASDAITVNELYYHHKNPDKLYKVIDVGFYYPTRQPMVVYKAEYGQELIWARPVDEWLEQKRFNIHIKNITVTEKLFRKLAFNYLSTTFYHVSNGVDITEELLKLDNTDLIEILSPDEVSD